MPYITDTIRTSPSTQSLVINRRIQNVRLADGQERVIFRPVRNYYQQIMSLEDILAREMPDGRFDLIGLMLDAAVRIPKSEAFFASRMPETDREQNLVYIDQVTVNKLADFDDDGKMTMFYLNQISKHLPKRKADDVPLNCKPAKSRFNDNREPPIPPQQVISV